MYIIIYNYIYITHTLYIYICLNSLASSLSDVFFELPCLSAMSSLRIPPATSGLSQPFLWANSSFSYSYFSSLNPSLSWQPLLWTTSIHFGITWNNATLPPATPSLTVACDTSLLGAWANEWHLLTATPSANSVQIELFLQLFLLWAISLLS